MTTQHTHHEHNDVDQSVVEYPSASETTTANSTSPSPEVQGEVSTMSSDSVHPVAEQTELPVNSLTEQDHIVASSEAPSTSNSVTTQAQEPSQNPVHDEPANQADPATIIPTTSEEPIANTTVTYEDEIAQTEVEATPSVQDTTQETQVQARHHEIDGNASAEVETQQLSHNANESDNSPIEQAQPITTVTSQIDQPSEQNKNTLSAVPDEAQTTPYEQKLEGAGQHGDVGETAIEVEPARAEVQPSAVISLPVEEVQTSTRGENTSLPAGAQTTAQQSFPYTEIAPLINAKAEEVRPFTEFIEEFRLAEAARLQSALQETQAEAFALLNSVENPLREVVIAPIASITLENVEDTEKAEEIHMQAEAKQPANTETKDTPATEQKTTIDPANRPVSPLLRPATRLRVPRHGLTRHQREEQLASEAAAQKAQQEAQESKATTTSAPTSEPASPKPARRYRFDRPSSTTANAKAMPAPLSNATATGSSNGSAPVATKGTIAKTASTQGEDIRDIPTNNVTRLEPSPQVQEQQEIIPEVKAPAAITSEQGRRRQTHKEPVIPTSAPVIETSAPIIEAIVQADLIAPEDLPPLEYSELQKANNSRRRRRHRSGPTSPIAPGASTTTGSEPVVPLAPLTSIPPMPQIPTSPATAPYQNAATNNAYNIVSGYTLNQMNQGTEIVGPFMGPEPSPARGSVLSRDGRTTRAESQRTPIIPPAPTFASRPAEHTLHAGPSAASMAHFANVISQAIQTQTDRTVAELRRANQSPTSVSVSLPPFPSTERVGVFVDVANLLYSARTLRIAVDFGKLLDFLRGNRRLIRAHAYCPTSPQPGDEQMFLQAVKGLGYRITTKNYKTFSSGAKKADLDLDLCMDVVRLVDGGAVDCIALVSGDSDFMPMLDYCSDHGVRVEVAAFDEAMSATLRQSCDLFVNLSMLEEIRA